MCSLWTRARRTQSICLRRIRQKGRSGKGVLVWLHYGLARIFVFRVYVSSLDKTSEDELPPSELHFEVDVKASVKDVSIQSVSLA